MQKQQTALVKTFKALSDRTRIEIVLYLAAHGETSCQDLSKRFRLSQPTLCHHYGKLVGAGLLRMRKRGVTNYYSIDNKVFATSGLQNAL